MHLLQNSHKIYKARVYMRSIPYVQSPHVLSEGFWMKLMHSVTSNRDSETIRV